MPMPSSLQIHRINPTTTTTTTSTATVAAAINYQKHTLPTWAIPVHITIPENFLHCHTHAVSPNQCCSAVVQTIMAPVDTIWSVVRRFDNPQAYKHFLKSCHVIVGDGNVGTLREVQVVSGLPAATSTERLEILDDESHVTSFRIVGGEHRLNNYRSVTTLHATPDNNGTVVVESYVVDVPQGNTKEETCVFALITYIHLHECNQFSIGIFCLPPSAVIPLHNHPNMTVFSKLLFGSLRIKSYDWVNDDISSMNKNDEQIIYRQHPSIRLAKAHVDSDFNSPCSTSVLFPTTGGNMHCFKAITPCAILDVLGPPYSESQGRHCAYFQDFPYDRFSGGSTGLLREEEDKKKYAWLQEREKPEDFVVVGASFHGPILENL